MSFALLFSGQGAQHPAMLPWLAEDETVRAVQRAVGAGWREHLADRAWAGRNANAQPLLTGLALAAWAQIAVLLDQRAVALAGYSVGELAACAAAGACDGPTAVSLAQRRAAFMDEGAELQPTALLGISGLSGDAMERLCADFNLDIAIRNGIDSVVVGGLRTALPAAMEAAQRQGARCTELNVQIASHTRWMAGAARAFADWIAPLPLQAPRTVLFTNAAGRVTNVPTLKAALARQIDHTVRWDECMEGIAARQPACVLEIGPGQALARMWNERYPQIPARSADEFRSARAIAEWVLRQSPS